MVLRDQFHSAMDRHRGVAEHGSRVSVIQRVRRIAEGYAGVVAQVAMAFAARLWGLVASTWLVYWQARQARARGLGGAFLGIQACWVPCVQMARCLLFPAARNISFVCACNGGLVRLD